MDKPIMYSQQMIRLYDHLNSLNDVLKAFGNLALSLFGVSSTFVTGLSAAAQASPNLSIQVASGSIFQLRQLDAQAFGALPSDSTQVIQQGYTDAQTMPISAAALGSGQEQWVLVQATFQQVDAVRAGDPSGGVLAFWNSSNPTEPLQGQGGTGGILPTVRKGFCSLSLNYGAVASAGAAVPPAPSGNNVGLYLILLSFGQTQITNGQILKAGNAAYAGYTEAPFCNGLLAQHHKGIVGHAPKIDLTAEVQNILPYANMNVSNPTPPSAGGSITAGGIIPVLSMGTVDPNGIVAGQLRDTYFQTGANLFFVCTTAGSAGSAVWSQIGLPGTAIYVPFGSLPLTPAPGGYMYECDTSGGSGTVNLLTAASMVGTPVSLINVNTNPLVITPQAGEQINGGGNGNSITLHNQFDAVKLAPRTGYGYYITP